MFKLKILTKLFKKKKLKIKKEYYNQIFEIYAESNTKLEKEFKLNLTLNNYPTIINNQKNKLI